MRRQARTAVSALAAAVVGALACVTVAGVTLAGLTVAGSAPAGAANTASEYLVARDDGAPVLQGGVRLFAGRDRYRTAVLLAERYARRRGGLGAVSTVILAPGEELAGGLAAAGLAGREQAPILLTRPDSLPFAVAEFIDLHGVSNVIAVGGTESIAERVLADVASLQTAPSVRRVAGADRYETAALLASELNSDAFWCGVEGSAAILMNGSDEHLAEAAGIGTIAFARELPILFTRRGELPDATGGFLRRHRIDRVVIVGGPSAVSDSVISPLLAEGVDEVTRVAAGSAGITGASMAELMTEDCRHELAPSQSVVALRGPDAGIDAVTAAPLLAVGLDDSGPVPLLSAGERLPAAVQRFLARTPREVDGSKNHLRVAAIGGRSAVDEQMMRLAVAAASSAPALTARISAAAGDTTMRVAFSETLNADAPRFESRIRDVLYINDFPAQIDDLELFGDLVSDPCIRFAALDVTLRDELEAGDVIDLEHLDGWYSIDDDRRPIRSATFTVPSPRPVFGGPRIEVIAPEGRSSLWVSVTSAEHGDAAAGPDSVISLNRSRVRITAGEGVAVAVGEPRLLGVDRFLSAALYQLDLTDADTATSYLLAEGDLVRVGSGAALDSHDRRSGARSVRVRSSQARLGVVSVRAGPPNPGVDDSPRTLSPDAISGVSERAQVSLGESLTIVGKWSGLAAGAAGNAWQIHSTRADTPIIRPGQGTTGDDPPTTQVWVDARGQSVLIRHVDAPAGQEREQTFGELVQLLNADSDFSRHFTAELSDPCADGDEIVDLDEDGFVRTARLAGGKSSVSFLVTFNDYVASYAAAGQVVTGDASELIDDILGALIPDYGEAPAEYPADRLEVAAPVPGDEVLFRFTTEDPEHTIGQQISLRGNRITIDDGIAGSFRKDDPDTADVNESVNAGRALFAIASRDPRLLNDLGQGANTR